MAQEVEKSHVQIEVDGVKYSLVASCGCQEGGITDEATNRRMRLTRFIDGMEESLRLNDDLNCGTSDGSFLREIPVNELRRFVNILSSPQVVENISKALHGEMKRRINRVMDSQEFAELLDRGVGS